VPWKHVSLATCLGQLSLSLFMWFTARRGLWDTRQQRSSPQQGGEGPKPLDTWQHRSSPQHGGKIWSRGIRGSTRAHLSKEVRSGAKGHMVAPEFTSTRRRDLGSWDTWQHRSSPHQLGEVWSWGTRDSTGAHLVKEVRSGAEGHVAVLELGSARR
jgi:hypothetical protein